MNSMQQKPVPTLAQPFIVATNANLGGVADNLASRLDLLKLRSTLLGVSAAIAAYIGVFLFLDNGLHLLHALRSVDGANGLPAFQIPSGLVATPQSDKVSLLLRFTFLIVWVAGIWGMSTRRLVGLERLGWGALLIILAVFTLKPMFDENSLGGISESALRRAIATKNWDAAEQLVQTAPDGIMKTYVFAQIALHAGDRKRLLQYGKPFVDAVDSALLEADPRSAADALMTLKEVRPEVVYALEMALYGAPRTSVGIAFFKHQGITKVFKNASYLPLWHLAASGMLLTISGMGLWLWLQMLRRIQRLQDWLQQGSDSTWYAISKIPTLQPHSSAIAPNRY